MAREHKVEMDGNAHFVDLLGAVDNLIALVSQVAAQPWPLVLSRAEASSRVVFQTGKNLIRVCRFVEAYDAEAIGAQSVYTGADLRQLLRRSDGRDLGGRQPQAVLILGQRKLE